MRRRYAMLIAVWFAVVALSAVVYVACMLSFGTFTEWYAETISFHLLAFGVTVFPLLLLALPVALVVCHRRWSRNSA
jgi:hypothetical protein